MELGSQLIDLLLPAVLAIVPITALVMAVTGMVAQKCAGGKEHKMAEFCSSAAAGACWPRWQPMPLASGSTARRARPCSIPLLMGSIFVIVFLRCFGVPYADYKASAQPVSWLLMPATVSLAIPPV